MDSLAQLLHRYFPGACLQCGRATTDGLDLCPVCRAALPGPQNCCPRCAAPLPAEVEATACGFCLQYDWRIQRCVALLPYQPPWMHWITGFKYRAQLSNGRTLSLLLARRVREEYRGTGLPQALLPMPMHWRRFWWRGFNQSMEIARVLGRELDLPLDARSCRRLRPTRQQVGLSYAQRRRNVRGAFRCTLQHPWRRVALVDDVLTSGATTGELARLLQGQGVEVHLWCLARAESPRRVR